MSDPHLPDDQLLQHCDGELPAWKHKQVDAHLDACWKCRARRQELETAISDFVRIHELELRIAISPAVGPRALLKARLGEAFSARRGWSGMRHGWAIALCAVLIFGVFVWSRGHWHSSVRVVSAPNSALTPGATLLVDRQAVCAERNENNRLVPVALQRRVLEQYGIGGADPRAYEIDYLVTPALGGADDIHNLWPHSYSSTMWNARVKDALEDRLREMVCTGGLDLATAQREIASDWIAAYKKYFGTDAPLPEHEN
jgi:hypothetical protein